MIIHPNGTIQKQKFALDSLFLFYFFFLLLILIINIHSSSTLYIIYLHFGGKLEFLFHVFTPRTSSVLLRLYKVS